MHLLQQNFQNTTILHVFLSQKFSRVTGMVDLGSRLPTYLHQKLSYKEYRCKAFLSSGMYSK